MAIYCVAGNLEALIPAKPTAVLAAGLSEPASTLTAAFADSAAALAA